MCVLDTILNILEKIWARAPSSCPRGIEFEGIFSEGYSAGGGLSLFCARSSSTGTVFLEGYSSGGGLLLFVPSLHQRVFHGRRSSSRGIPRAEACSSLCQVFLKEYSTDADLPQGVLLGRRPGPLCVWSSTTGIPHLIMRDGAPQSQKI